MGLRIGTNVASLDVQKNLRKVAGDQGAQLSKLSSGKRITKAADDAAGLAIATNLDAQTRGLRQATRNANDGIALVQTAEGGLNEVSNMMVRLRELTIQAASDTVGDNERELIDKEYQQLLQEVDRIADSTKFNGANLLNGENDLGTMDFHVGAFGDESNRIQFEADIINSRTDEIGVDGTGVSSKEDAQDAIEVIDQAINKVSGYRAHFGSIQSRLASTVNNLEVQVLNQDNARSGIEDTDFAHSSAKLAQANVIKQSGISTLAQANNIPNSALRLIS